MKCRTIAVANQKGGVGKTTTVVNLGACLAELGRKVLIIDMDPQANATLSLGLDEVHKRNKTIYNVLLDSKMAVKDIVQKTTIENLSIAPSHIDVSSAEIEMVNMIGREIRLKDSLLNKNYDYIFIDCPPSLSLLTINGLTAAEEVFITIQAHYLALEGLAKLLSTIQMVKDMLNHKLTISGILITLFDKRTNLARESLEEIKSYKPIKDKVFNSIIGMNIKLAECPGYGQPIIKYAPASEGARAYMELAKEVMNGEHSSIRKER